MFCRERACLQFSWSFSNMLCLLGDLKVALPQGKATDIRKQPPIQETTAKYYVIPKEFFCFISCTLISHKDF